MIVVIMIVTSSMFISTVAANVITIKRQRERDEEAKETERERGSSDLPRHSMQSDEVE